MILHIATFDFVEGTTEEDVAALTAALEAMAAGIPQLRFYRCGASLRLRPGGADYGVAAIVDDAAALDAYLDSAAHADVFARFLGRMTAGRHAAQLELDPATLAAVAIP